jgi:hypothetical protein
MSLKLSVYTALYYVNLKSYIFRLCKTTIISFLIPEIRKEDTNITIVILLIIKLMGEFYY